MTIEYRYDESDPLWWVNEYDDPDPIDSEVRRQPTSSDLAREQGRRDWEIHRAEVRREQEIAHAEHLQREAELERQHQIFLQQQREDDEAYRESSRIHFNELSRMTHNPGINYRSEW